MLDSAKREERFELSRDIAAEIAPTRERMTLWRQRVGVIRKSSGRGQPGREMRLIPGNEAHARRGHVDAMDRVGGVIGKAGPDDGARLVNDDAGIHFQTLCKAVCDGRTREATADDGDDGPVVPIVALRRCQWLPFFQCRQCSLHVRCQPISRPGPLRPRAA